MLPEFSQAVDQKILECLNHAWHARRVDPVESRVDILNAMTPSLLSHISSNAANQRMSGTGSPTAIGGTLKQSKPLSPVSSPLADKETASTLGSLFSASSSRSLTPIAGECSSNRRPASQMQEGSFLTPAPPEVTRHNSREAEDGFLRLRMGDIVRHSLGLNQLLRIHIPGLHVELQQQDELPLRNQSNGHLLLPRQPSQQPLLLELHCLSSSGDEGHIDLAHLVDLDEGDWIEQPTPGGVLFSRGGLLLKRRSTLLRLRIRDHMETAS